MVPTPVNVIPVEIDVPYRRLLSMILGIPEHACAMQIHESIVQGFPATLLSALCERGDVTPAERNVIVPLRTFKTRLAKQERLTVAESDRLFRVAHVIALARAVFGGSGKAARWLRKPKERFDGQSPIALVRSSHGVWMVEEMLVQLAEGFAL